jgi:hypothetical protein
LILNGMAGCVLLVVGRSSQALRWPGLEDFLADLGLRVIASPASFGKEIYRGRNISDGHIQTEANPSEPKLDQLAEAMDLGQRFLGESDCHCPETADSVNIGDEKH